MSQWSYTHGWHDLGKGTAWAYLQPDGTWGWSNTVRIISRAGDALQVDTLYDLPKTRDMLSTAPGLKVSHLVNTHGDGDHCYGNQEVGATERIVSARTAQAMERGPAPGDLGRMIRQAPPGAFIHSTLGPFEFTDEIVVPRPTQTFTGRLTINVGEKEVHLIEVGPAHTAGDTLVYIPADGVLCTGDILFMGCHPVMWAGPLENWLAACNLILEELEVSIIVPGHGPITTKQGVVMMKNYLLEIQSLTQDAYTRGLPAYDAGKEILRTLMAHYPQEKDPERVVATVATIYRHLSGDQTPPNIHESFRQMAQALKEVQER